MSRIASACACGVICGTVAALLGLSGPITIMCAIAATAISDVIIYE